jgi:hypothetical protein
VSADLDALRGVIQAAFGRVLLDSAGNIVGMTPGARMTAEVNDVVMIAQPLGKIDGRPATEPYAFKVNTDSLDMSLDFERMPIPLNSYNDGANNRKVARRTL